MARVHCNILKLPQAATLGGTTAAVHCYGSANPLADAVSRGNKDYFHMLCAQLGVAPVQLSVSPTGRELLANAVRYARSNGLLKVPDAARAAARLAMEHGFGSEFSSDVTGDGPCPSQGFTDSPKTTLAPTSGTPLLLPNRMPVRSGASTMAPPAPRPQTPIPPRARVPSPWVSACNTKLPRTIPPRATVHSAPTLAPAIDVVGIATARARLLTGPIAIIQRAQVHERLKVSFNESGAKGCGLFRPSNARRAALPQPGSALLQSTAHSSVGTTTHVGATVRPSPLSVYAHLAALSLRSVTKAYRLQGASIQEMLQSPTQRTTSRRRALSLNALRD